MIFYHPISLSPHLPIFILMGRANFFMDATVSSYLSLIHNSRPDTVASAESKMLEDLFDLPAIALETLSRA